MFIKDGNINADVERKVNVGNKMNGAIHAVVTIQSMAKKARLAVHIGVLVPTYVWK